MVDKFYAEVLGSTGLHVQELMDRTEWLALLNGQENGADKAVIIAGNAQTGKTTLMDDLIESFMPFTRRAVTARSRPSESKDGRGGAFTVDFISDTRIKNYLRMKCHVMAFDAPYKPDTHKGIKFPKPSEGYTLFYVMEVPGDTAEEIKLNAIKKYISIDTDSKWQDKLVEITHIFTTSKEIVDGATIYTATEHLMN